MKFLIALKNTTDESKNILEIGCKIAEGFSADLTICYIGKQSRALIEGDVNLARQTLSEWNIHHPGLEVLRSEEHTSELQSRTNLVCRLLLEKKKI